MNRRPSAYQPTTQPHVSWAEKGSVRRPTIDPPTLCAPLGALASDRSSRADAFVRSHGFVDIPDDALHAAAVFAIEYFERRRLSAWADFPVEAFAGVHLPGELYGFDALRAGVLRALPFFFAWLARAGAVSGAEAVALAKRVRDLHQGAYRATSVLAAHALPRPAPSSNVPRPGLPRGFVG